MMVRAAFPSPFSPFSLWPFVAWAAAVLVVVSALALPFLFGYTESPSANFWPLLASWGCAWVLGALALSVLRHWPRSLWVRCWSAALVLAALLAAVIGLLQYFLGDVGLMPWVQSSIPSQAIGNLRQRNQQGTLLSLGLWALLWALAQWGSASRSTAGSTPTPHWWGVAWGAALAWALVLLAAASAATASRTAALQWLLVLALVLLWRRSGSGWGWVGMPAWFAALLYLLTSWALPWALEYWTGIPADRLLSRFADDGQGCGGRRVLWSNMLQLVAQKPWTGWGWGELDYAHYVTDFSGTRFCVLLDNAHNLPLHLAVEWGLPVALLVTGGVLGAIGYARPWRERDPARQLAWGVLALIGLHSLLEFPLWYGPFQVATAMALGVLLWPPALRVADFAVVLRGGSAIALALTLAAGSYAAWDYHRIAQLYKAPAQRDPLYRENTWAKVSGSWLFADQVDFARLTTLPLTLDHAQTLHDTGLRLLHFSPEQRVIEALLDSTLLLGLEREAAWQRQRYRTAYPEDYARWEQRRAVPMPASVR